MGLGGKVELGGVGQGQADGDGWVGLGWVGGLVLSIKVRQQKQIRAPGI